MTLALVLARKGVPVTVLDAGDDLSEVSRASTVHASTLELFDELGVAWDVIEAGSIIPRVQYRDRKIGIVAEFDLGVLAEYTRFPIRMQTDQSQITRILRRQLDRLPCASLRFGHEVQGVVQDSNGVRVEAKTAAGTEVVEAQYAVGADGAHSAIRQSLNIDFPGERYESRYLMILTTFDVFAAMPDLAPVTYLEDEEEAGSIFKLPGHNRVVFHLPPNEDESVARSPERIQRRLRGFLPPTDGDYPVIDALVYALHRRVAATFRVDRVLLAGDAAHLNNPTGGMGMNSGIHDAYALGKALSSVIAEEIDQSALDGYAAFRRSVASGYIHVRSHLNQALAQTSTTARAAQDEQLRRTANDPVLARDYLLKASMFDTAPRVLW
jgi:3-(3-hydroxy-phenyl)propionate hydroxylase